MKLQNIDIQETINKAKSLLEEEKNISKEFKAIFELLLLLISLFCGRMNLNSKNSSTPPSEDKNRKKKSREKTNKKPGAQSGHVGARLEKVSDPDEIKNIKIDRRKIPKGYYREVGFESRQVFDIKISRYVIEYRAEILEDSRGQKYIAPFPEEVKSDVQYGSGIKAHAVYLSQEQLIPYQRVQDYFESQIRIPLSVGSIFNFNLEVFKQLEQFEHIVKEKLINAAVLHADETGINVNGKRIWLHNASNEKWTHFFPHEKRGTEAMNAAGILPVFSGVLSHDHWKPYYTYSCTHALCNAHHLRELEFSSKEEKQKWAKRMRKLLLMIKKEVDESNGSIESEKANRYRQCYRKILLLGEKESPIPEIENKKRGKIKKSKSRNLLERLRNYEKDVSFANNQSENDIRMTKVQQKISGCFRSMEGAQIFCRIRSYLSTCKKNDVNPSDAIKKIFEGKLPSFLL